MKAVGTNTADEHERDGDHGAADLVHGLVRGLARREPERDVALDVLDDDDRVVDDDADGEHQAEQVSVLSEKPNAAITAKVPMSETGIATIGMSAVRQDCRKTMHDDDDEADRLEERLVDLVDRCRR